MIACFIQTAENVEAASNLYFIYFNNLFIQVQYLHKTHSYMVLWNITKKIYFQKRNKHLSVAQPHNHKRKKPITYMNLQWSNIGEGKESNNKFTSSKLSIICITDTSYILLLCKEAFKYCTNVFVFFYRA